MSRTLDDARDGLTATSAADPTLASRRAAAWAAAGLAEEYVIYERPTGVVFAGGVRARIRVYADTVDVVVDGAVQTREYTGTPAEAMAAAVEALPFSQWRLYGWTAFEFTAHLARSCRTGLLAEFILPAFEIAIGIDGAVDPATVPDELREPIAGIVAGSTSKPAPIDVRRDNASYAAQASAAIDEIRSGAYDKIVLSRRLPIPFPVDLPATYAAGREANTPARSFLLKLSGFEAAGFAPEIVCAVHPDRTVETQPLAGTRALNGAAATPQALRDELLHDSKEIVEHVLSVQLACSEMDLVAEPGTRVVSEFMAVRERGSVQHLASTVRGRLADGVTLWRALDVLFPAVTASGIPKAPAIDAIRRLESQPRGLYSGAVVTASSDGDLDAALVLRSIYAHDGQAWLQAGAGIIAQSDPAREFEETCEKLGSVAPYLMREEKKYDA